MLLFVVLSPEDSKLSLLTRSKSKIFFWNVATAPDAWVIYWSGIKTLLATGLSTFFINGKLVFNNGPKVLSRNRLIILDSWIFDNLILADKLFVQFLRSSEASLPVSNNLCRKLVSLAELPIIFDNSFRVTLASFFVADFSLLSCEIDTFAFTLLYWLILILILYQSKINESIKHIRNILTVPCQKSKIVSFTFSRMK